MMFLVLAAVAPLSRAGAAAQAHARPAPVAVASYGIDVRLDTAAHSLTGRETITYTNTTRTAIPDLVFHLYLNAFRDRSSDFLRESADGMRGFQYDAAHPGWIKVDSIRLDGGPALDLKEIEDGTLAQAALPEPLPPGKSLKLDLKFHALLPHVFARTGFAGDYYMVGQWFPKLGVWQDGKWNAYPFHANAEFYADFGTYDVSITRPKDYITGGTGLPQAESDNGDGTKTTRYHAESVIDFAWTASPHYKTASRTVNGIEVLYLYLPEHDWTVQRVLDSAEFALSHYGDWYGPYPYPRLTLVDAPEDGAGAGGMEYPTLVTVGTLGEGSWSLPGLTNRTLEGIAVHEIGHQWWQSTAAFNEAEEPWLDEGFTDYSTLEALEAEFGAQASVADSSLIKVSYLDLRRSEYLASPRVKMFGTAWSFRSGDYEVAAYAKPVLALRTLRNVLGGDRLRQVLHAFYQRYQFAHPTTRDFQAVAEQTTGEDLGWFFDGLVYGDGVLNYRVDRIAGKSVTVAREGGLVIPTEVLVTFSDGSTSRLPWDGQAVSKTFTFEDRPDITTAEVDPDHKLIVDLRWWDNGLSTTPQLGPWAAVSSRLFDYIQQYALLLGGL